MESERFARQIQFAPLGIEGQARIAAGQAFLVGVGALGTHLAEHLVRAGVGRLWLIDRDVVEWTNLQRQVLFDEDDARAGLPKAVAAAVHLAKIHARCELRPLVEDFSLALWEDLGVVPQVILDGTDNFATRYLLNDIAHRDRIPWIYGGAVGAEGVAMAVLPQRTPCLRCLLPDAAPGGETASCETIGVLAPAVAMVSAFQAAQALKILAGHHDAVARGVLRVDAWHDRYRLCMRELAPATDCPCCGAGRYPALEMRSPAPAVLCGRDAVQVHPRRGSHVALERLAQTLRSVVHDLELTEHLLRFAVEGCRISVFPGGRAIVFGTADAARAVTLYDRWVGG